MMAHYRRRPIEVEAKQWFPNKPNEDVIFPIPDGWANWEPSLEKDGLVCVQDTGPRRIPKQQVRPGYWIVIDPYDSAILVYTPEEFNRLYEPI